MKFVFIGNDEDLRNYFHALATVINKNGFGFDKKTNSHSLVESYQGLHSPIFHLSTRVYINGNETQIDVRGISGITIGSYGGLRHPPDKQVNCFIVLFNYQNDESIKNVNEWVTGIKHHEPGRPIFLVGIASTEKDTPSVVTQNLSKYAKDQRITFMAACSLKSAVLVVNVYRTAIELSLTKKSLKQFRTNTDQICKSLGIFYTQPTRPKPYLAESSLQTLYRTQKPPLFFDLLPQELFSQAIKYYVTSEVTRYALTKAGFAGPVVAAITSATKDESSRASVRCSLI